MAARITGLLVANLLSLVAGPQAEGPAEKQLAELQGTWKLVSVEEKGMPGDVPQKPPRWVIKGNKVLYAGKELAALAIDPKTNPKSLDLTFVKSKRVLEGVCAVTGDTLKVCVNRQSEGIKERPQDFATKEKPDYRLLVFERLPAGADPLEGLSGFVGIAFMIDKDTKEITINTVIPGSPAEKGGLKKEDRILRIGAEKPAGLKETVELVRQAAPGSDLALQVRRGGQERTITIRVGVLPFYLLD